MMNHKRLLFSLFSVLLLSVTPARAQLLEWGLRFGMDVKDAKFKSGVFDKGNRMGFQVGPVLNLNLPLSGLSVEAAAQYHNFKIKAENETTNYTKSSTVHNIDIPITAKYGFGFGTMLSLYAETGPQFSFNVGDKDIFAKTYSLKTANFSWNVGCGLRVMHHAQIGYNYNIACGHHASREESATVWNTTKDVRHNTHQIQLTYYF